MAKMNPGTPGMSSFQQPGQPQKRAPGEQMRLPYVPPSATSAAQPLQMSGNPAMLTMPKARYGMAGPRGR